MKTSTRFARLGLLALEARDVPAVLAPVAPARSSVASHQMTVVNAPMTVVNSTNAPAVARAATPAGTATFKSVSDWKSGQSGEILVKNNGTAATADWTVSFDFAGTIQSVWNAAYVSRVGNRYTIKASALTKVIGAGESITVGFNAVPGGVAATNFAVTLSGTTANPPRANRGPVAMADAVTTPTNTAVTFNPLSNDFDPDGNVLTVTGVSPAANGTVTKSGNALTYTPRASFAGTDSFRYTVSDSRGGTFSAVVTVSVGTPTNRPPVAASDRVITQPGKAVQLQPVANDTDPDGNYLTISTLGTAKNGTVTRGLYNTVVYTPKPGYKGADSFTYTVSDGRGGTSTAKVNVWVGSGTVAPWPEQVFAPYFGTTYWPTPSLVQTAQDTGVRFFTLAFVQADSQGRPSWGGFDDYAINGTEFDVTLRNEITTLRGMGGDVAISFGGAAGNELAQRITDVVQLTNAYRSVINAYGATHVDFDIEGEAAGKISSDDPQRAAKLVAAQESIERRSQAIATLQQEWAAAGKELHVRFTLAVTPAGLDPEEKRILQSAKSAGVRVDLVNVMTMDYGSDAAPNPLGRMGDYAIQAAESLFDDLTELYGNALTDAQKWKMIGVTPLLGINDVPTEVFDQTEAREVLAWARQRNIGMIGMWAINRDQQFSTDADKEGKESGIPQTPMEFSRLFKSFTL